MNTINQESILAGQIQILIELEQSKGPVTKEQLRKLMNEKAAELVQMKRFPQTYFKTHQ